MQAQTERKEEFMNFENTKALHPVRRLLIVDDDPSIQNLMTRMIHKINPNSVIEWATSVDEAQTHLEKSQKYDIVLSDVQLGTDTTGLDLSLHWRSRMPNSKFMLMTGTSVIHPPFPLIKKPFRFKSVRDQLKPFLISTRSQSQLSRSNKMPFDWYTKTVLLLLLFTAVLSLNPSKLFQDLTRSYVHTAEIAKNTHAKSLVDVFYTSNIQRSTRDLLLGGLTPLLHDRNYWSNAERHAKGNRDKIFSSETANQD